MGDLSVLMDMGFSKERAEYALSVTNFQGVEPAMEWLLAHTGDEIPQSNGETTTATTTSTNDESTEKEEPQAKSLKCDTCGKVLVEQSEVEFHAAKTGHTNFSESSESKKPLTEEERKAQLALIEEKLKQKRIERQEREKEDALERERNRIRSGKDMTEARRRLEEIEMKKIIEQRKREKAEEKAARDRVRAQIEADKAARKNIQSNTASSSTAEPQPYTPPKSAAAPTSSKTYTETRIQIRLLDGSVLTETFNVKEQLSAIRVFIQMKTALDAGFGLMTPFPRKVFTDEDFDKPLDILGLVPSAVLTVTKPTQ